MAKCCGDSCVCKLTAGDDAGGHASIEVSGTGTVQDPFVVALVGLNADDSTDIDFTLTFDGTTGYHLTAGFASTSKLDHIGDVNASAPTNGQVLAWSTAHGAWEPAAPATAAPGAVTTDDSLSGDGSVGAPLEVSFSTGGGIEGVADGIKLTDATFQQMVRHFATSAARTTADPTPSLNALSMLDTAPGLVDVWNGTAWEPLLVFGSVSGDEYLNLSGAYDGRSTNLVVKQVSLTTGSDGSFVALSVADLTGAAGVLSAQIQAVGSPFFAVLDPTDTTQVAAIAYAADGSGALVSQPIAFTLTAITY